MGESSRSTLADAQLPGGDVRRFVLGRWAAVGRRSLGVRGWKRAGDPVCPGSRVSWIFTQTLAGERQ